VALLKQSKHIQVRSYALTKL